MSPVVVQVVEHHAQRGVVEVGQLAHEVEDLDLEAQVEVVRGLVEQQHPGALGQARRQPHPLQLAPRELVDGPFGHAGHPGEGHGPLDRGPVGVAQRREPAAVRVPPEGHDVADLETRRVRPRLGQEGDPAGERPGRERRGVFEVAGPATHPDLAAVDPVEAGEGAQHGRLAAAVGADERGDHAGTQAQRHPVHHRRALVGEYEVLTFEHRRRHVR
jgi:hypothetical protein